MESHGGRGRHTVERSAVAAGHSNAEKEGKEWQRDTGKGRQQDRGEEGDEGDSTLGGDDEKRQRNEKRLGRSLRTHPQPEDTTLSVLSRKDLPA